MDIHVPFRSQVPAPSPKGKGRQSLDLQLQASEPTFREGQRPEEEAGSHPGTKVSSVELSDSDSTEEEEEDRKKKRKRSGGHHLWIGGGLRSSEKKKPPPVYTESPKLPSDSQSPLRREKDLGRNKGK